MNKKGACPFFLTLLKLRYRITQLIWCICWNIKHNYWGWHHAIQFWPVTTPFGWLSFLPIEMHIFLEKLWATKILPLLWPLSLHISRVGFSLFPTSYAQPDTIHLTCRSIKMGQPLRIHTWLPLIRIIQYFFLSQMLDMITFFHFTCTQ